MTYRNGALLAVVGALVILAAGCGAHTPEPSLVFSLTGEDYTGTPL